MARRIFSSTKALSTWVSAALQEHVVPPCLKADGVNHVQGVLAVGDGAGRPDNGHVFLDLNVYHSILHSFLLDLKLVVLKLRGGVPPLRRGTAGGPVCRPYKGERSLISNSVRETVRVAPTSTCLNPGGRVRTPAPTACREAVLPFVGAGHWPARRCTRRVQEAAPYSPAPAITCSTGPGAGMKSQSP